MIKYLYILIGLIFFIPQGVGATAYYVDFSATNGTFDGLATTTAFSSLDAFTEVARSAGDIAFVRRGVASTTNVTDLNFTSDGTITNPIIISADYDNLWSDFATSTQTYSVAVATSTFYASASITGIAAGDWIYVAGDCFETYNSTSLNQCEFAYEVSTVSGTALSLYLPYKGNQSGSALDLRIMPDNPQWNATTGIFSWNPATDNFWIIKGIRNNGGDTGQILISSSRHWSFIDSIIECGDDVGTQIGFSNNVSGASASSYLLRKTRIFNCQNGFALSVANADDVSLLRIYDSIIDGNNFASSIGLSFGKVNVLMENVIFRNHASVDISNTVSYPILYARNVDLKSTTKINNASDAPWWFEDFDGVVGSNRNYGMGLQSQLVKSTTTVIRSGGGATSIEVNPDTNIARSIGDWPTLKLFEYPIYTNTTSKQYDVYFMSTSTAAWTADPLATELWIECEYWAHDTNATSTRKIKKSTGVVDFNGSTAWQALSVTCVPTQTGIMYLRGWYAKTKEAIPMNEFFVDGTPIIQ